MTAQTNQAISTRTFLALWIGQSASIIGSGLTGFALGVWIYQQNQSATQFMLTFLFYSLPGLLMTPIAGNVVDRFDRRKVMMVSDIAAGIGTIGLAAMFFLGSLMPWHVYLGLTITSIADTFRVPAFLAITTMIVPKQHLGRSSGLIQLAEACNQLITPLLGGLLYALIDVYGVLLVDFTSFIVSLISLLLVRIPKVEAPVGGEPTKHSVRSGVVFGWNYIITRPALRSLMAFIALTRLMNGVVIVAATPLLLTLTSVEMMGMIRSLGGVGALIGSILISVWGGGKQRTRNLLITELIGGLCILIGGLSHSIVLLAMIIFVYFVRYSINLATSNAILLSTIPSHLQGRVRAITRLITFSALPLSYLISGPAVDYLFEPLLAVNGPLAGTLVEQVIGTGPGRGIAFLFTIMGTLDIGIAIGGLVHPRRRRMEEELSAVQDSPATPDESLATTDVPRQHSIYTAIPEGGEATTK